MIRLAITKGLGIDFRDSLQPVISDEAASSYSIDLDGTITFSCKYTNSPTKVTVELNGKAFVMAQVGITNSYTLTLTGYTIGICTAVVVAFYAAGTVSGSKVTFLVNTVTVIDSLCIDNVKTRLYYLLSNDATLQAILEATPTDKRVYHIKKPVLTEAGEKLIVFNEITSSGRVNDEYVTDEYYQLTIESDDSDFNDRVYERVNKILLNYNWATTALVGHRIRMDWKSPDILQEDGVTWQLIVRYAIITERRT